MLPITPVYEGKSSEFLRRLATFVDALPDIFRRVQSVRLDRSYSGLARLRFVEALERGCGVVSSYDPSTDTISVYPMAFSVGSRIDLAVYAGLGERYWHKYVSNTGKVVWGRKLVKANRATIDRISDILDAGVDDYRRVLEKFHSATDRLQVIHVLNALIANNISPKRSGLIDIITYPPTKDFCSGSRPYSIKPLLSAYSNLADLTKYPVAFAQFCSHNGKLPVCEMSVQDELITLFKAVSFESV